VTALRPGVAQVGLSAHHSEAALGFTYLYVLEPPGADSVVSMIQNVSGDSARLVMADASGATQRSQTLVGHDSTCWVTRLSDSVRYSVAFYPPGPAPSAAVWVTHSALSHTHTWQVVVADSLPRGGSPITASGSNPDPGEGC
jgi:hypothetical protein